MSQVILKLQEGGQPALYKRGNDDIDKDAFIRAAESEFNFWLDGTRLKDKQRREVLALFSKMLEGINNNNMTYVLGGGFNNSLGITNAEKGFDAAGIAAGFLGNLLRLQSVYKKPEPTKSTYNGATDVGNYVLKNLFGPANNPKYFIDLDLPENGVRGHTERIRLLKELMDRLANDDSVWTELGATPDLMKQWRDEYAKYTGFNDNLLTANEYLGLSKLLGLNNLDSLFWSLDGYSALEDGSTDGLKRYTDYNEWLQANHPRSTQSLGLNRSVTSTARYSQQDTAKIDSVLNSLSSDKLLKLIGTGLSYSTTGFELAARIPELRNAFGGIPQIENNYLIQKALELGRSKGVFHQFGLDSNNYYIPIPSEKADLMGRGLVYKIDANGNHTLVDMDKNDIPYFANQWRDAFVAQVPAHKQGGTIRKFEPGGPVSNVQYNSNNYSWDDIIYNTDWFTKTLQGITLDNYIAANDLLNRYTTDKINDKSLEGSIGKREEVAKYLTDFNKAYGLNLNEGAIEAAIKAGIITRAGTTGDNKQGSYTDGYSGAITNLRHLGTKDHAKYIEKMNEILKANKLEAYVNEKTGMINFLPLGMSARSLVVASAKDTAAEGYKEGLELFGLTNRPSSDDTNGSGSPGSKVDEVNPPLIDTTPKTTFGSVMLEVIPDLIGAGRLYNSLRTNKNVYKTILPTLRPVLKNTYERYSPVTGAFSTMLFFNNQGNQALRTAQEPFTSDASLAAGRLLEGQRQANELQAKGFLADDLEIKRTQAEALARQEDNMARRSEVANFNRASINQTNRERAQLKASLLKLNWLSWDNFLQGIESRMRGRFDENRERINNFQDRIETERYEKMYLDYNLLALDAFEQWKRDNNKPNADITEWLDYKDYVKYLQRAREMTNSMLYSGMASRYNLPYTNPFNQTVIDSFFTRGWGGRRNITL